QQTSPPRPGTRCWHPGRCDLAVRKPPRPRWYSNRHRLLKYVGRTAHRRRSRPAWPAGSEPAVIGGLGFGPSRVFPTGPQITARVCWASWLPPCSPPGQFACGDVINSLDSAATCVEDAVQYVQKQGLKACLVDNTTPRIHQAV